jgi:hypothetical protein
MKRCLYVVSLAGLAFASAVLLAAQGDQNNPFVGTWKLNVAKSKFNPGPAPKAVTVTISADGKVSVDEENAEGKSLTWSYTSSADTAAPIEGMENSTVVEKRSGNTVDHDWKFGDTSMKGHGVLSKNGKTMTYTMTGTDSQGRPVHNVEIYNRQSM